MHVLLTKEKQREREERMGTTESGVAMADWGQIQMKSQRAQKIRCIIEVPFDSHAYCRI